MLYIFLAVIGSINVYVYHTIAQAFPEQRILIALLVLVLFTSLIASFVLEKQGHLKLSLPFSRVGYLWLGSSFIFASLSPFFDLHERFSETASPLQSFWLNLSLTTLLTTIGYASARSVRLKTISLHSPKVPRKYEIAPYRIIQISDLHLGDSGSLSHIRKIVAKANGAQPNLIVSTGDLFDGYLSMVGHFVDELKRLQAPDGKLAVIGNHEVIAGLAPAIEQTEEAGFEVLRNRSIDRADWLTIAGIDDPAAVNDSSMKPLEEKTFTHVSKNRYTLFLNHRPSIREIATKHTDLQLSGHTHGGQIFPFWILTKFAYKAKVGLSEIAPQSYLYLSRGTGSWGPQLRLLAPPEITLIELHPTQN